MSSQWGVVAMSSAFAPVVVGWKPSSVQSVCTSLHYANIDIGQYYRGVECAASYAASADTLMCVGGHPNT
jgi:hypothetical protein